jgi:2-polyprenyl-3-methyl-5-hydroxy-6-metoxy-1,4-benzoquinol methylase
MGNPRLMARALHSVFGSRVPLEVLEIGAGDGKFLLSVARRLPRNGTATKATILDRFDLLHPEIRREFERVGWGASSLQWEISDWLEYSSENPFDAIVANLFLHHFSESLLRRLFSAIARRTHVFVAVEPRRSGLALAFSKAVGLIGCNSVTRHDAPASVRAGFAHSELSQLWPADANWFLQEGPAGWCSHLFVARKIAGLSQ